MTWIITTSCLSSRVTQLTICSWIKSCGHVATHYSIQLQFLTVFDNHFYFWGRNILSLNKPPANIFMIEFISLYKMIWFLVKPNFLVLYIEMNKSFFSYSCFQMGVKHTSNILSNAWNIFFLRLIFPSNYNSLSDISIAWIWFTFHLHLLSAYISLCSIIHTLFY